MIISPIINSPDNNNRPGVKQKFTIELQSSHDTVVDIRLCARHSNSYRVEDLQNYKHIPKQLIPHHRFLNKNGDIIDIIENVHVSSTPEEIDFYYIDDMPGTIDIRVEVFNKTYNINSITGSSTFTRNHSLTLNSWTPDNIKFTYNGVEDIQTRWSGIPLRWYATLHEGNGPIIFNATYSGTLNVSVTPNDDSIFLKSELLNDKFVAFQKNKENFGWVSGRCTILLNVPLDYINVNLQGSLTGESLSGSTTFKIKKFEPKYEIRKHNESWDIVEQLKEYAMAPHINTAYNLWENFMGSAIGGIAPVWSSEQQLGRTVYSNIANFTLYHVDIDECNVPQLYSIVRYLDSNIDDYNLEYPPAIKKLMDLGSISHSRLWGEIVKCDLNITDKITCSRCGYDHSNLGKKIKNPESYNVTPGKPIIVHDKNIRGENAWSLIIPPISTQGELSIIDCIKGTLIAISASGQYMIGRNTRQSICISKDYGNTWETLDAVNATDQRRFKFAISESGKYIAYIPFDAGGGRGLGELMVSEDYGETFSVRRIIQENRFRELSISDYGEDYLVFITTYVNRWEITRNSANFIAGGTQSIAIFNNWSNKTFITSTNGQHVIGKLSHGRINRYFDYGRTVDFMLLYEGNSPYPIHIGNDGNDIFILEMATSKIMYRHTSNDAFKEYTNLPTGLIGNIIDFDVSNNLQTQVLIESLTPNTPDNRIWISIDGGNVWRVINVPLNWVLVNVAKNNPNYILLSVRDGSHPEDQPVYLLNINMSDLNFNFINDRLEQYKDTTNCEDDPDFGDIELFDYSLSYLVPIDKCDQYDFYEYEPGYPILDKCDPKHPNYHQAVGVINWNDPYTTLLRETSSLSEWFGEEGILQDLIEFNLLKGLEVHSSQIENTGDGE